MFLGIDVSKNTLDVALLKADASKPRHKVFANTVTGHQQLLAWLSEQGVKVAHACLEATGTWGNAIALALHEAGHKVSLVNPALIRAFGQSQLKRTKTDKAGRPLGRHSSLRAFARCTSRRCGHRQRPKCANCKLRVSSGRAVWKAWKRCT